MTNNDWRYNDQKMETRKSAYSILLKKFGSQLDSNGEPIYNMKSITECANDWVSQGNVRCDGIVAYYKAYYTWHRVQILLYLGGTNGEVVEWLMALVLKTSDVQASVGSNPTLSVL